MGYEYYIILHNYVMTVEVEIEYIDHVYLNRLSFFLSYGVNGSHPSPA